MSSDQVPSHPGVDKPIIRFCSVIERASRPSWLNKTSPRLDTGGAASAPPREAREIACLAASALNPSDRMALTTAACGIPSVRSSANWERIARNVLDADL